MNNDVNVYLDVEVGEYIAVPAAESGRIRTEGLEGVHGPLELVFSGSEEEFADSFKSLDHRFYGACTPVEANKNSPTGGLRSIFIFDLFDFGFQFNGSSGQISDRRTESGFRFKLFPF
jgi:hypothetical protein